jgi:hypothetical protein
MTVPTVVLPADPREIMLNLLQPLLPAILPGWRCGWRQDHGFIDKIPPGKFIALDVLSDTQLSHVHDQFVLVAQVWGDNGITDDRMRTRAARIVSAHIARALPARRDSFVPSLPDPFDQTGTRYITQVTMTALLKGEDQ